jgi:ribose-phosphate pyrophosphokinase
MQTVILADAVRRASPKQMSLILTHYGYGRQDRKDRPRVPLSAKVVANMLSNTGAHNILIYEIHNPATQGFFDDRIKVDLLYGSMVMVPYLNDLDRDKLVIVAPDSGGVSRADLYAQFFGVEGFAIVTKFRNKSGKVDAKKRIVIGNVKGKVALIVDDMIDTAGTIITAAEALYKAGAVDVLVAAAHPVFSGDAIPRLNASRISRIIVTDSIFWDPAKLGPKIEVVSGAGLLSKAIAAIHEGRSISNLILKG